MSGVAWLGEAAKASCAIIETVDGPKRTAEAGNGKTDPNNEPETLVGTLTIGQ